MLLRMQELGAYCHKHVFYSHELHQWKAEFLNAFTKLFFKNFIENMEFTKKVYELAELEAHHNLTIL